MARKLIVTKIKSVDLVGEGSCNDAHISLYKSKQGGIIMNYEELKKSLTPEELTIVEAEIAKAKGEIPEGFMSPEEKKKLEEEKKMAEDEKATAEAMVAKMTTEIEVLKSTSAQAQSEEEILKSADLAPAIRTILESNIAKAKAAEVAIKKMQENANQLEFIAKAKEVSFVPEADTKVVALLKSINGIDGAVEGVMDILKSVNTIIEKGVAFKELGTASTGAASNSSEDEAWSVIEKAADSLVVKGQVTKAKAIEMVIEQQPELYNTYVKALKA